MAAVSALRVPRLHERRAASIISYIVAAPEPRPATRTRQPPPSAPARALPGALLAPPSSPPARLWSYDAAGEIVFDHAEQYRRCLEARAAHHNEADCPEPHDPHPLALHPG